MRITNEVASIELLLNRVRTINPEIGRYLNHASSYENIFKVGIATTEGWLYITRGEIAQSSSLDLGALKAIAERFKKN